MRISDHDMEIKAGKVMEFLGDGDVVKIELRMRGREQAYGELGRKQLENFLTKYYRPRTGLKCRIKRMGGTWCLTVAPTKPITPTK